MDLAKIISVTGKSGLFEIVGNSKSALIVSSMVDGKRMPVMSTHRISSLDEISIFTEDDDLPLIEVLIKMREHEKGEKILDPRSEGTDLFAHFEKILPDFDKDRVHASDIKKLFTWYNILQEAGKLKELQVEGEDEEVVQEGTEKTKKKAKPSAKKKKAAE